MPVSGRLGLISKLTGGSESLRERASDPVGESRTARPGPSFVLGPPKALAGVLPCRDGRPGQLIQQRALVPAQDCNCHFVTVITTTAIYAEGDLPSRSGQEILT
jgi:hypothetical protein